MDMTENPFIALLFMTNSYQQDSGSEPQLDILLKTKKDEQPFQEAKRIRQNKRLVAQRGAFLNFEHLGDNKVLRISIKINYVPSEDGLSQDLLPEGKVSLSDKGDRESTLNGVITDIQEKLKSFHYFIEDLFPDFYVYLKNQEIKYTGKENLANQTSQTYKLESGK